MHNLCKIDTGILRTISTGKIYCFKHLENISIIQSIYYKLLLLFFRGLKEK